MLSIESEGKQVAKWLTGRGIAAFILNYRLNETPAATADFEKAWTSLFQPRSDRDTISSILGTAGAKLAMSDGLEAIKRVRRRAVNGEYQLTASAFLAFRPVAWWRCMATAYDTDSRPNFVGALPEGLRPRMRHLCSLPSLPMIRS
jgi:hypothetical protein